MSGRRNEIRERLRDVQRQLRTVANDPLLRDTIRADLNQRLVAVQQHLLAELHWRRARELPQGWRIIKGGRT